MTPTRSGQALAKILLEEPELRKALEQPPHRFHRSQLWRYSTGRGTPTARAAALLQRLTGGRVAADGWVSIQDSGEVVPHEADEPSADSDSFQECNTRNETYCDSEIPGPSTL